MHTGSLESLHALILAYAPKLLDFDPPGYQARVQVAIMDHNHNYQRKLRLGEYSFESTLVVLRSLNAVGQLPCNNNRVSETMYPDFGQMKTVVRFYRAASLWINVLFILNEAKLCNTP